MVKPYSLNYLLKIMLTKEDTRIIEVIEKSKEFEIKKVGSLEMKYIHELGIHMLQYEMPILYDQGALKHFLMTKDDTRKTKRLSPSQTVRIIQEPEIILPNFRSGSENSYLYVEKLEHISVSIVEVVIAEKRMRVTHGGFEIKDIAYLKKAKELRSTILEGRPQK